MAEHMKMRVNLQGDIADIRVLMQHPMETGQRRDESGQPIPARFIQTFTLHLNGALLVDGQLNTSVSRNPLFAFKARGVKAGDVIAVAWTDNTGETRRDEIRVG